MLIPGRVKDSTGEGRRSKHDKLFVKAAHTEKKIHPNMRQRIDGRLELK